MASAKGRHTSTIQNELLLASLTKFFNRPVHLKQITEIVNGTSDLSLRLIDWFVTNYSKTNNVVIIKHNQEHINVYIHYRSQLRAYSKHLFDPFRRQDKITLSYQDKSSIQTTIGQLNFFRWAIENEILDYIHQHYDDIISDMNMICKARSPRKKEDMESDIEEIVKPQHVEKGKEKEKNKNKKTYEAVKKRYDVLKKDKLMTHIDKSTRLLRFD